MNLNETKLLLKLLFFEKKQENYNDCIRRIYYWNKGLKSMWFLKQKSYAVGYFDSIILLNLGTSSNFHMNSFTVLRLIEDYNC